MDGVLIDSVDVWLSALNTSLTNHQYSPISRDEFIQSYWGHDLRDTLQMMNIPITIVDECSTIYSTLIHQIRIYPSTRPTLEQLGSYPKAIITNTAGHITNQIIKHLKLDSFFSIIATGDTVQRAKPDPELIYRACELLNIKPQQAVFIGDTLSDVIAGRAAGCPVIGLNIDADYMISDLSELIHLLQ
jgi:HAD superfamily hydrolase (TIGR01509 family)